MSEKAFMPDARRASDDKSVVDVEKDSISPSVTARTGEVTHVQPSKDADAALAALGGGQAIHIDEATNKRLLKKIDWNLMPVSRIILLLLSRNPKL
jgi:hypothetical protein